MNGRYQMENYNQYQKQQSYHVNDEEKGEPSHSHKIVLH